MVIIRLARSGAKKNPYYFVTVADERKPRDGSFIERLGFFNPSARGQEERLRIDLEKLDQWVSKGAQLSDRVKKLVKDAKLSPEELQAKLDVKKQKAEEKKALAEKAAKEAAEAEAKAAEKAEAEANAAEEAAEVETKAAEEEAPAEEVVEAPAEEAAEEEAPAEEVVEAPAEEAAEEEAPAEEAAEEEAPAEEVEEAPAEEESEQDSSDDEKK
jgi:small subunit ribosomal protein S16